MFGLSKRVVNGPAVDEAESVPYLVAEIAALLTQRIIVHDVVPGRSIQHQPHAHTVGAEAVDQFQRIGRVAKTLAHLAA